MSLNLIDSYGKHGVTYGLYTKYADVTDTEYLSRYFVVSEFNPTFTAGKNSFSFNGSTYLQTNSLIYIECLDSNGNNLYIEMAKCSDQSSVIYAYKEVTAFVFSIQVYGDTADGVGKIILYGTLSDGRSVKWMQNITINKTLSNSSRVRFYIDPVINVESADVPVLSSDISQNLVNFVTLTGNLQGLAVTPPKDTNLSSVNKRTTDLDYRLIITNPIITNSTPDEDAFNSQMVGATINLNINRIQLPLTQNEMEISDTASYFISDVINNNTLNISLPYYYKDQYGNYIITNIIDADFSIQYPFVNYNDSTSSYQTTTISGITYIINQSYADITYENIRTFSGYVARHKIYRKSLLSNADFSVVADEPIVVNEILSDDITQNKFYQLLGKFYNDQHIARYWFTSSNNISLSHSPSFAIDSMFVSSPNFSSLSGSDYFMVKNDSVSLDRNAMYIPFDTNQFLSESGSSYDSNFMALKANVQYIVEISAVILKNKDETNAQLSFYLTSSIPEASQEQNFSSQFGVNVANITASQSGSTQVNFDNIVNFFVPQNDLYGTLVVVPKLCQSYIESISFRVYGDDGFSPDVFSTRIPWNVSVANECFDIKAELFDINNTLVYSNLNTFQNFDPSGSTLIPYVPGGSGIAGDVFISGSLYVSESAVIEQGDLYIYNMPPRPGVPDISQSRLLSIRADGAIVFDPIIDISSDNSYLYVSTDNNSNRLDTVITTKKSIVSEYDAIGGRKIYWNNGTKIIETSP